MAVGPNFNDPETQAAIAAQGGAEPAAAEAASKNPAEAEEAASAAAETEDGSTSADESAGAEGASPQQGDSESTAEKEESEGASSTNMDDVELPSQEEVDKALADAGFSNDDLGQELVDNDGKLTEETIEALKEKFDATAVDNAVADMEKQFAEKKQEYLDNQDKIKADNAKIEDMNTFIFESLAGGDAEKGKENLDVLSKWAQENMDPKELSLINKKLASGDKELVTEGLQQAVDAWKKGQKRPMMTGSAEAAAGGENKDTFKPLGKQEFKQIMASEKYQTDPEYAAEIDARRRRTMETEGPVTPEYSASNMPI